MKIQILPTIVLPVTSTTVTSAIITLYRCRPTLLSFASILARVVGCTGLTTPHIYKLQLQR
jgi:hypothetical protein